MKKTQKIIGDRSWTVRMDKPGDESAIEEVYVQDCYRLVPKLQELAASGCSPWILDVGGHVGAFSALVMKHLPQATVIAIEPFDESADIFEANVHGPNVFLLRKALRHDGANLLTDFKLSTTGNKVVKPGQDGGDYPGMCIVPTITISEILDRFSVPFFDITKMDCELSEHDILPVIAGVRKKFGLIVGEWHAMPSKEFKAGLITMFQDPVLQIEPSNSNDTMGMFRIEL